MDVPRGVCCIVSKYEVVDYLGTLMTWSFDSTIQVLTSPPSSVLCMLAAFAKGGLVGVTLLLLQRTPQTSAA